MAETLGAFLQSPSSAARGSITSSAESFVESLENMDDPSSKDNIAPELPSSHSPPLTHELRQPSVSIDVATAVAPPLPTQPKENSRNIPNLSTLRAESRSQNNSQPSVSPSSALETDDSAPPQHDIQPSIDTMTNLMTSSSNGAMPLPSAGTGMANKRERRVRNYQVFPGRNRFYLGGRLLTSRDGWPFLVAFSLLVVPSGLFAGFVCPWLWQNLHPAIPVVFGYLFLLGIVSMLRTSLSDPGIIPRNLDPHPPLEDFDSPLPSPAGNPTQRSSFAYGGSLSRPVPPKPVTVNDSVVALKYCDTCRIYRPPRASHCRPCDNCVENEDHHCVWLNNCIGRRNYRSFFTFIVTATFMCLYVVAFSLTQLLMIYYSIGSGPQAFVDAIHRAPIALALVGLCFVLVWSVGSLSAYHVFLVSRNVTTHEQLRASIVRRQNSENPFDFHSMFLNCLYVLCRPRPKSYLQRRKYAPEHELSHAQPQLHRSSSFEQASEGRDITALDVLTDGTAV